MAKKTVTEGKVLIIDDDEFVCMAVADILEFEDIQSMWVQNGRDGVALYQKKQNDIALVILDLFMPGWDGSRTLQALRAVNPDICIILSSGYSKEDAILHFNDQSETPSNFLAKPYDADDLIQTVKQNLTEWRSDGVTPQPRYNT